MTIYRSPADRRRGPNCGPTSIAVLTNQTLTNVMVHIAESTNKRANWKGSTLNPKWSSHAIAPGTIEKGDIFEALTHFGANPVLDADTNERFCGRQIITAAACLPQDKAYLILTGGHAQACVDGLIFDQNSGVEGDDPSKYWGRKKIVSLIIECDRLPETTPTEEPIPMTTTITATTETAITAIAEYEAVSQTFTAEASVSREAASSAKMVAFAHTINVIIVTKVKKGSPRAGDFRRSLEDGGVSKASSKRFVNIGMAASRLKIMKGATDVAAILAVFADASITNESKLKAVCFPKVKKTTVEALVKVAVNRTKTADEALQALLDAAAVINPAVQDVANTLVSAINQQIAA